MSDIDNITTSETSNIGKPWTKDEDTKLIQEYTINKLDINTIATLHKRNLGGVRSRLAKLGLIDTKKQIISNNQKNSYQDLVNEHNNKETILNAKIRFYKDNKEQLIRIKLLEIELVELENEINKDAHFKKNEQEKLQLKENYIKICSDNCKDAFQVYLLNIRNNIRNGHQIQINTLCRKYYINYTFSTLDEKNYKVITNIPNYSQGIGMNSQDNIYGNYSLENGFTLS